MIRLVLTGFAILVAWTIIDTLLHRFLLKPLYEQNPLFWRPFDQLNLPLVYIVTFTLIAIFVVPYWLLVQPKSLLSGLGFGASLGLALGIASGFGTYIHMPIPWALAWGWLIGGWIKGIVAGAIVGALVRS